jgi:hypothetical protein
MARDDHQNVLAVSSGGSSMHFYMVHEATARAQFRRTEFSNCMTYVYSWEDGVFSCQEIYVPDFSSLTESGLPGRWSIEA